MTEERKVRIGCGRCGYELLWRQGHTVCVRGTSLFFQGNDYSFRGCCRNCGASFIYLYQTGKLNQSLDKQSEAVLT